MNTPEQSLMSAAVAYTEASDRAREQAELDPKNRERLDPLFKALAKAVDQLTKAAKAYYRSAVKTEEAA